MIKPLKPRSISPGLAWWIICFVGCLALAAAEPDVSKLPPPAATNIDFARDIKPILIKSCIKCHGPEKPKSKFRLDTRKAALEGGENGVDIIPGDGAKSPLIHYVARLVEDMEMPPNGKGDPLTREQIASLRAWIDQGLSWPENEKLVEAIVEPESKTEVTVSPTVGWFTVRGNEQKFREQIGTREGWNGGIGEFTLKERLNNQSRLFMTGRALRDDYRLALAVERSDVGFMRFGFEQYRKYYEDTGGYHPSLTPSAFRSDQDLHLDIGRAWVDFGLTLPRWPRMVLGYEYQFKDGTKSALNWGATAPGGVSPQIYPAFKGIMERVHVLKFDLDHEIKGLRVENNFRGEFTELSTRRVAVQAQTPNLSRDDVREGDRHFQGANTLRLEKKVNDWLFTSGGYLYSKLSADARFNLDTFDPGGGSIGPGTQRIQWQSQDIVLERESHVLNVNSLLGPWNGLTFSAGAQSEWMRQKGLGTAVYETTFTNGSTSTVPATHRSNLDRATVEENVALRYTKIPFTVLFAEARLQQESIGHFEEGYDFYSSFNSLGFPVPFVRDTDAASDLKDFRAGFSTSPWRRVSLSAHARRYEKNNHYRHRLDDIPLFSIPNDGYSAFILARDTRSDQVEAKLALRLTSWLKTTLSYKLTATEYFTDTEPVPGDISPGGSLLAGRYDAHTYSLNTTLTPWRRFYLSSTFTYQDARTYTASSYSPYVVPHRGDVYSALVSATYALSEKTDLHGSYSFSLADFGQSNFADAVPLGISYQQHGLQAGLRHRFKKNIIAGLKYGFYWYDEPGTGRVNNYTAHAAFATLTFVFP